MDVSKIINDLIKGAGASEVQIYNTGREEKLASARETFHSAYARGFERGKIAFLGPMVGMAASALAPALARGAIGKVAPRMAQTLAKPIAGAMFDTGVSMAANKALGG